MLVRNLWTTNAVYWVNVSNSSGASSHKQPLYGCVI